MTTRISAKARAFAVLLMALLLVAMHQVAHVPVAHDSHQNHTMMADHHSGPDEHPSNCDLGQHACQAVATPDFVLQTQVKVSFVALPDSCLTCSRYSAARKISDPPERASLSIWRV